MGTSGLGFSQIRNTFSTRTRSAKAVNPSRIDDNNGNGNGLLYVFTSNAGLPVEATGNDKPGAAFGKWRFWLHQAGYNDNSHREAAQRYLQEVTR